MNAKGFQPGIFYGDRTSKLNLLPFPFSSLTILVHGSLHHPDDGNRF
jgi:hypothetical protein